MRAALIPMAETGEHHFQEPHIPRALMAATAWGHYSGIERSPIDSCAADSVWKVSVLCSNEHSSSFPRDAVSG
jgi:hypothetical protein